MRFYIRDCGSIQVEDSEEDEGRPGGAPSSKTAAAVASAKPRAAGGVPPRGTKGRVDSPTPDMMRNRTLKAVINKGGCKVRAREG